MSMDELDRHSEAARKGEIPRTAFTQRAIEAISATPELQLYSISAYAFASYSNPFSPWYVRRGIRSRISINTFLSTEKAASPLPVPDQTYSSPEHEDIISKLNIALDNLRERMSATFGREPEFQTRAELETDPPSYTEREPKIPIGINLPFIIYEGQITLDEANRYTQDGSGVSFYERLGKDNNEENALSQIKEVIEQVYKNNPLLENPGFTEKVTVHIFPTKEDIVLQKGTGVYLPFPKATNNTNT